MCIRCWRWRHIGNHNENICMSNWCVCKIQCSLSVQSSWIRCANVVVVCCCCLTADDNGVEIECTVWMISVVGWEEEEEEGRDTAWGIWYCARRVVWLLRERKRVRGRECMWVRVDRGEGKGEVEKCERERHKERKRERDTTTKRERKRKTGMETETEINKEKREKGG